MEAAGADHRAPTDGDPETYGERTKMNHTMAGVGLEHFAML